MTSTDTTPRNCIEMSSTVDPLISHLRVPYLYRIRYILAFVLASSNFQHLNTPSPPQVLSSLCSSQRSALLPFMGKEDEECSQVLWTLADRGGRQ